MAHAFKQREARVPIIGKLFSPFEEFVRNQSLGGFLLLFAAVIALLLANSPWAASYFAMRDMDVTLSLGSWSAHATVQHIINDGLMALFFFVVGLEIKRELLVGELNSVRKATLPIAAAVGGMVVPAAIYAVLNRSATTLSGWAIPMATDIAFALGILALLGWRVPLSARIFLTSLAIIDDIGAVLVIAVFYSEQIVLYKLFTAAIMCLALLICNRAGVQSALVYGVLGSLVWASLLGSGIHATIAGVLVAATIPVISRINPEKFQQISQIKLQQFAHATAATNTPLIDNEQEKAIHELGGALAQIQPPMFRLQHILHPWSLYLIMPAFAFFNAGISFRDVHFEMTPLTMGICFGLVVGKPLGILIGSWVAVKMQLAVPPDLPMTQFVGLSFLAGIGFTMALFIANLAFDSAALIYASTAAIIVASFVSACIGCYLLYRGTRAN